MSSVIKWFEIPVQDFNRAKEFYETIFNTQLQVVNIPGQEMGMFHCQWEKGEIGGSIVKGESYEPSQKGAVIYLDAGENLQNVLDKVENAGGQVVMAKAVIPMEGAGFMGFFIDTEGNRIGICSPK